MVLVHGLMFGYSSRVKGLKCSNWLVREIWGTLIFHEFNLTVWLMIDVVSRLGVWCIVGVKMDVWCLVDGSDV